MVSSGSGRTHLTLLISLLIVIVAGFVLAGYVMDRQLHRLQNRLEQVFRAESEPKIHPMVADTLQQITELQASFQEELALIREVAEASHQQSARALEATEALRQSLTEQANILAALDHNVLELLELVPEETALAALAQAETARLTQQSIYQVYYLLCHALHHQPVERVFYPVGPGDNLWSISARFTGDPGLYSQIAQENNLIDNSIIRPGQWVWIPTRLLSPTLRETLPALIPPEVAAICGPLEIGRNV